MASQRVSALTRDDILATAKRFQWTRKMQKWTVVIDGNELPARPLVLEAAGVPPNDPTNSHQAVAILQDRGFEVRYRGKLSQQASAQSAPPDLEDVISKLRGSLKGRFSLLDDREREHRIE